MNQNNLNRFQGSTSISSDDYFSDGRPKTNYNNSSSMAPDMNVIKQDLREGVTKVAGKLSNIASNVMNSLQVGSISISAHFYNFIFFLS